MPQKIFHTVIYLKIPFHPYQPTFGRDEFFFSFFFQNTVRLFPKRLNTEKKNLIQMCYCDVRTLQTKSTMYKQCKQNSRNFAKKVLVIKLDPPKDLDKSTRLQGIMVAAVVVQLIFISTVEDYKYKYTMWSKILSSIPVHGGIKLGTSR